MPKKEMYSFKIEDKLIDKVRKAAKEKHVSASAFIRIAILEKLNGKSRLDKIEERLEKKSFKY